MNEEEKYENRQEINEKTVNVKAHGGIPDIVTMIVTYILTGELISSLLLSNGFIFTWKTTVVYFLFFITATVYIVTRKKSLSKAAVFPGAAALLLSLTFAFHWTQYLSFVVFLAIILLSGIYCVALTKSNIHSPSSYFYFIDILRGELLLPLCHIFTPYIAIIRGLKSRKTRSKKTPEQKQGKKAKFRKALPVILGILFAVTVLWAVVPLLIKGDAAFGSVTDFLFKDIFAYIGKFFSEVCNKISDFLEKIFDFERFLAYIPALFISPYIFSVMFSFRHGIIRKENRDTTQKYKALRKAPKSFIGAFSVVISAVYVIYLLSQTAYFFSAFTGHLPSGVQITVTEYARRGFFEMVKVAVINLVVIAFTVLCSKRENGRITGLARAFDVFLCAFTVILSLTSVSKIILYINRFGFTQKRVYVFVFDIILIIAFICIILRLFIEKFPYMKIIISSVCVTLTVMGFVGTDKFIADRNAEIYMNGKYTKHDIYNLSEIFPASFDALYKLTKSDDGALSDDAQSILFEKCSSYYFNDGRPVISEHGLLNSDASFDNLDEYRAVKTFIREKEKFGKAWAKRYAYVMIDKNSDQIDDISVSTKTQTQGVKQTDNSCLEAGTVYFFDLCNETADEYTFEVKADGKTEIFNAGTNFIIIRYFKDKGEIRKTEYFSGIIDQSDVWLVYDHDFEEEDYYE